MAHATCSIEGCDRGVKTRGWCQMHYLRWYHHGDPLVKLAAGRPADDHVKLCSIAGCERSLHGRGWCHLHYKRWLKFGDPIADTPIVPHGRPLLERLADMLEPADGGCLVFTGSRGDKGYGLIAVPIEGKARSSATRLAHRVAWELAHGPIPDGLFACHRCDNPPCCNVDHLFLGTAQDNVDDMWAKGRQAGGPAAPGRAHLG